MCSSPHYALLRGGGPNARPMVRRPVRTSSLGATQEGQDCQDQEYKEQHLRDAGRAGGKTAKAQNRGHDGNDEKHDCVVKHFGSLPPPATCALALCVA